MWSHVGKIGNAALFKMTDKKEIEQKIKENSTEKCMHFFLF